MVPRSIILSIVLSSALGLARAQDTPLQTSVRRLDFIHFDTVNESVEWKVSRGAISEEGTFVPSADARYSINLQTRVTNHDGEDGVMSARASEDVSRVIQALAMLIQSYTDRLDGSGHILRPDSQSDINPFGSSEEDSTATPLLRIASQCTIDHRFRPARTPSLVTMLASRK